MNTVLHTLKEVKEYFSKRDFSTCAFDTETTDLGYYKLDIVGCSFSTGEATCYIDLWQNEEKESIILFLSYLFSTHIKSLVMHNAPFDMKVLHKIGITDFTRNIFCTMTAHHLINENANHGLKNLACKYLGVETVDYGNASICGYKSDTFYEYACNDAKWTWELHKIFNKKLFEFGVNRLFFEVEMPFQFVIMDMEINGIKINAYRLEELRKAARAKKLFLERKLYEIAHLPYSIQCDMFTGEAELVSKHKLSNNTISDIFESRGLKSPYLTEGGKMSTGKETLLYLKGDEFVDMLYKYNIVNKLLSSFVDKVPNHLDADGRVRASFNNTGTTTGRLSSSNPNMQNNPKINPELPFDFKSIFEAPEGKTLISADYCGQELRLLAIVANEDILLNAFRENMDPHLMTANSVFGLGIEPEMMKTTHPQYNELKDKYKHERHIGKNSYNFPIIYGTTAYGISKNTGITEEEAQKGIDKFFQAYPRILSAMKKCSDFLKQNWHVKSLTRRRRRLDPNEKKSYRQAFNFLIQGLASDLIRCACNNVRKLFEEHPEWEAKILFIVHDEIVFEIKEEYVDIANPMIKETMETAMNLPLRMEVELGVGKTYSEAK